MSTTISDLYSKNVQSTKLDILLFGPGVAVPPSDTHAKDLLAKRLQIRDELLTEGHVVKFGEDIVDPHAPAPVANPFLQELLFLGEFDLIFVLVYTPGSLSEAGMITARKEFAEKTHFFLCDQFKDGLPYHACVHARDAFNSKLSLYSYPTDLTACNLLSFIEDTVKRAQVVKYLSP